MKLSTTRIRRGLSMGPNTRRGSETTRTLEAGDVTTSRWKKAITAMKHENLTRYLEQQNLLDTVASPAQAPPPPEHEYIPLSKASVLPIPAMNIAILVVGTTGDINPFIQLGLRLQAHGHRIRIASHVMYREHIVSKGFEYYPLGGDPVQLSKYAVKSGGRLIPKLDKQTWTEDVPLQMRMLKEIISSAYPACTSPDPDDPQHRSFLADAIIANPPTFGHVHVAEALAVPLHMMFPQPWTPTHAFPHPYSNEPYDRQWSKRNYYSYEFAEVIQWMGMGGMLNTLRKEMGLQKCGIEGANLLTIHRIPWVKMWSPALCPKPADWPSHVDVVGNFFNDDAPSFLCPHDLSSFLSSGPPPLFVGFGSVVIPNVERVRAIILEAAVATDVRVLVQSGWTDLRGDGVGPPNVFFMGKCPHDWLFPRVCAVVHHGGAGTVAAGLRAGKPTMICPFNADQFFWGEMVKRAGCGAPPCPVKKLTTEIMIDSFKTLTSQQIIDGAKAVAVAFSKEDGPRDGVTAFHKNLPVHLMIDDISVFLSKPLLAHVYCLELNMKVSREVQEVLTSDRGMKVLKSLPSAPKSITMGGRLTFFDYAYFDLTTRIKREGWTKRKVDIDKSNARYGVVFMDKAQRARHKSKFRQGTCINICTRKRPWLRGNPPITPTISPQREEEILTAIEQALAASAIFRRFDSNNNNYLDKTELSVALRDLFKTNNIDLNETNTQIQDVVNEILAGGNLIHFSEFAYWTKNFKEGKALLPGVTKVKLWAQQTMDSKTAVQILQEDVLGLRSELRELREEVRQSMQQLRESVLQDVAKLVQQN